MAVYTGTSTTIAITSLTGDITGVLSLGNRHVGNCYAYFQNKHILGDYIAGKLYQMSSDLYTDNGDPIYSTRVSSVLIDADTLDNVFLHKVFVDAEVGKGISGSSVAPTASLAISRDGGDTWSADRDASLGLAGYGLTRLLWRRLGYGTSLTAKLTISANIRKILVGAYGEVGT